MALEDLAPETRALIDGRLVEASTGARFDNVNPSTEEVIGSAADCSHEDVEAAVAAARRAFDESDWAEQHAFRSKCLRQLSDALLEEKEQLRSIVVREAGAPVSMTGPMQVDTPISTVAYWAEKAESYPYEAFLPEVPIMGAAVRRLQRREPIGVTAAITPWNVPLLLNLTKVVPALAAGCTAVLKPAPDTPWCATHLGKLIREKTDIPPGVVNIVPSSDHRVGEILTRDPRVDLVTFTGSTATGRRVMECASQTLKKVFLELGGKSAEIILDDAELERALPGAALSCVHGGQGCVLTTRWLVPRKRYDEAVEIMKAGFERWNYGDPEDPKNLQGPQVSRAQQERVLGYIEKGVAEGARLVTGGGKPAGKGFFVEPTLFAGVDPKSTIAQEEIFGPVVCVIPYDDDDDAVRIANDSIYGLSGAVRSASEERALAVAKRIRTGTLAVNGAHWFHVDTPFGGYKQSGIGRENGTLGFEEHLETKVIALPPRKEG
jgi:aldehyde dehydrogenase (NAD+)